MVFVVFPPPLFTASRLSYCMTLAELRFYPHHLFLEVPGIIPSLSLKNWKCPAVGIKHLLHRSKVLSKRFPKAAGFHRHSLTHTKTAKYFQNSLKGWVASTLQFISSWASKLCHSFPSYLLQQNWKEFFNLITHLTLLISTHGYCWGVLYFLTKWFVPPLCFPPDYWHLSPGTAPKATPGWAQVTGQEPLTHFCFSALYCCVQSSKSFWFISMNSFSAL